MGSTRAARRAGRYVATRATTPNTSATLANVAGSLPPTPYSSVEHAPDRQRAEESQGQSTGHQHRALSQYQLSNLSKVCAKGHANADFTGPLGHDVAQHPVDPHGREQQGEPQWPQQVGGREHVVREPAQDDGREDQPERGAGVAKGAVLERPDGDAERAVGVGILLSELGLQGREALAGLIDGDAWLQAAEGGESGAL